MLYVHNTGILDSDDLLIHLYIFSRFLFRSPSKNYSYAIKFATGSAGFNMVRNEKFLGSYEVAQIGMVLWVFRLIHIFMGGYRNYA